MARPTDHLPRGFYPVKDIAGFLRMNANWVRSQINAGEFMAFKQGTCFRVSGASVNKWIDANSVSLSQDQGEIEQL